MCSCRRTVDQPRKRWIDCVIECIVEKGLNARAINEIVHDRIEWKRFVRSGGNDY